MNVASLTGGFAHWKSEGRGWMTPVVLEASQHSRYARHLSLPVVGETGQLKLLDAKILLLGTGGLGSPAARNLAAAGVGRLGTVNMDEVDESNLQRQILHDLHRVGDLKLESAKKTIADLNPDCVVVRHSERLVADNAVEILSGYDIIVDGTDNLPTRFLLNDASTKRGIPVVHGSIFRFESHVTVFDPHNGPTDLGMCPEPPPLELAPSCAEAIVWGVLPGTIGTIQALEAPKLLLGIGDVLRGRLLTFDALDLTFRKYQIDVDPANRVTKTIGLKFDSQI